MMKNLILINSSPRENGICAETIRLLRPKLADCRIKQYDVFKLSPAPCTACGYCEQHDGCVMHDLDIFFEDFEQADYVLFVTPVYNNFFPAPLKALLDRFQRYYSARFCRGANPPIEKPKKVGAVIVSGSNARRSADFMVNTLRQSFTVLNGTFQARYYIPETDTNGYTFYFGELDKFITQFKN